MIKPVKINSSVAEKQGMKLNHMPKTLKSNTKINKDLWVLQCSRSSDPTLPQTTKGIKGSYFNFFLVSQPTSFNSEINWVTLWVSRPRNYKGKATESRKLPEVEVHVHLETLAWAGRSHTSFHLSGH